MAAMTPDCMRWVAFYLDTAPGPSGHRISHVRRHGDRDLESRHDYIQWLFPILAVSANNPDAPVWDDSFTATFGQDTRLHAQLQASIRQMTAFFGWNTSLPTNSTQLQVAVSEPARQTHWLSRPNHNYQRHSRIMRSLILFDLSETAQSWFECLDSIYTHHAHLIGDDTYDRWCEIIDLSAT